jgi:hypothetical protein
VARRQDGGACDVAVVAADVAGGRVGLAGCCRVRTEPVAALRAEARSSSMGHDEGAGVSVVRWVMSLSKVS